MRRLPLLAAIVAVLFGLGLGAAPGLRADDGPKNEAEKTAKPGDFDQLDSGTKKTLCLAARAYFDPEIEFLWRPRKNFKMALEGLWESDDIQALKDIPFLRQVVYQGRHFLQRFSDKKWQKEHDIESNKGKGLFLNLKSEDWQFTYTLPRAYPKESELGKAGPRKEKAQPRPLLICLHDMEDTRDSRDQLVKYPGEVVLARRYPKGSVGKFYDNWLTLAPVAPRARFLEDNKSIRHVYLTSVVTEFWRRYHVDFDQIVIDGADAAAACVAVFPHIFAGVVLRGGEVEPELVKNYASVPVFVVNGKRTEGLEKALKDAGHPDVTSGSSKDVLVWLNQRKRIVPTSFEWRMTRDDHRYANWVALLSGGTTRSLKVDTDRESNTITVSATGIESIQIALNDEIVDLDKKVILLINGTQKEYTLERDFGQTFDQDPSVRKNMNFGWLYPVLIDKIYVPEKPAEPVAPSETDESTEPEDTVRGSDEDEATAKKWYDRGVAAEAEGNSSKARTWYQKTVEVGVTSYKAKAERKLEELEDSD